MRGWHIGSIAGIDIQINPSWLFVLGLLILAFSAEFGLNAPALPGWQHWSMGAVAALLLFASVLLHELAHSFAAMAYGVGVARITLFIFGGVAQTRGEAPSGPAEFVIAAVGPVSSAVLGGLFLGAWLLTRDTNINPLVPLMTYRVGIVNIALAVFNLLPAFPLDGGRLLRASLWEWWGDIGRSTRVATSLGRVFSLALMGLGAYLIFATGNFIGGLWIIAIGWMLGGAAAQSRQMADIKQAMTGVRVRQVMRRFDSAVETSAPLEHIVYNYMLPLKLDAVPVADDEALRGILTIADARRIPREQWAGLEVAQVMQSIEQRMAITADTELGDALDRLAGEELEALVVTGPDGELEGILTRRELLEVAQALYGRR